MSGADIEIRGGFLSISSQDFYGPCATSPNMRYVLGWRDGGPKPRDGKFVLLVDGKPRIWGQLERPNDGVVADNGAFALCSWASAAAQGARFCVFSSDGKLSISHRVRTNLRTCGISDNGHWSACVTCGGEPSDGDHLFFFDLANQALLWKLELPVVAHGLIFDQTAQTVFIHVGGGEGFRYSFHGQFLDQDALEAYWLEAARKERWGYRLMDIADNRLAAIEGTSFSAAAFNAVATLASEAATKEISPNVVAGMQRALGEVAQKRGWAEVAAVHYRRALDLDPKIGVKRRLRAIEAAMGQIPSTSDTDTASA